MKKTILVLGGLLTASAALAQGARNPFTVGAEQGGGSASGLMGWILTQQSQFYLALKQDVIASAHNGGAALTLIGLSFAYGVFHAAGPGHGKAVVASYMLANEQALKRGLVISLLAALLQGLVAIALVSAARLIFNVTQAQMNASALLVEQMSFVGIIALGLWLTWTKGRAFLALLRPARRSASLGAAAAQEHRHDHGHDHHDRGHHHHHHDHHHAAEPHVHDEHCGHFHAPDPKTLGQGFSWRAALTTVVVAGSRPCSGAILVLVFALSQGIFLIGVWSTLAMSLGTAITTGALAAMAVLAKGVALRFVGAEEGAARRVVAGLEVLAAVLIVLVGVSLLAGSILGGVEG